MRYIKQNCQYFILLTILFTFFSIGIYAQENELLRNLLTGNQRYLSGNVARKDYSKERSELTNGQHPYAIILSCSDSRVPPEIIFDESLGKLFIVRVAGNVVDPVTLGSLEYAAEHLHTKLLVVLGHQSCGAVKAALEGGEVTSNIEEIINSIKPAVKTAKSHNDKKISELDIAIEQNVKNQINACLINSSVLKELVEKKEFQIVGATYSLETGVVKIFNSSYN